MPDTMPLPTMTLQEANTLLTQPGGRFEMGEAIIDGRSQRIFTKVPATLRHLFDSCARFADREYLIHENERVTYTAFSKAAITVALQLQDDGIEPGDRVAIIMRNVPEFFATYYGAILAGAIVTPLNSWWVGAELEYGLIDSGAKIAFVDAERFERVQPHLDACKDLKHLYVTRAETLPADARLSRLEDLVGRPNDWIGLPERTAPAHMPASDDEVAIFYTSGTTGRPKGAVATHRNILTSIASAALPVVRATLRWGGKLPPETDPLKLPQRVNLLSVPLFHATGMVSALVIALNSGTKVVMMRRWNAAEAVCVIEREGVMAAGGVPTIALQLLEEAERTNADLSSLTTITYGGAPAPADLTRRIKAKFPKLLLGTGWGMTETMATVTSSMGPEYESHPDSAGSAIPVNDVQIRDRDDGRTLLPLGEIGELWARGPQIVKGYWNRPEATAATFVDGWLRTGDLARLDEEGYLVIADRAKDMLIRGGENIYCLEVENALFEHPDVADVAVVGIPHATLGEEPAAVVRLRSDCQLTEAELKAHAATRLAAFKVPVRIVFQTEELPRNANGKVIKTELRGVFV